MANQNLLSYGSKVNSVEQITYSPVSVRAPYYDKPITTTYCFLAKVDPWTDDNAPPVPTQDQKSIKKVFKNIFAVKKISSGDISPVITRVNWTNGVTYDYYQDDVDMFELDGSGNNVYNYYVKNRYDQVFKCLWNNNDSASTIEPYFEPGTYTSNNLFIGADGYKWKYVYTIDVGSKVKFMDTVWMPVPTGTLTPNPLQANPTTNLYAGAGSIDVINVLNTGSGYDPANSTITVTITGDGSNAVATPVVSGGHIVDILVTNPGRNYTYANVTISSTLGANVVAIAPTSPVGGHSFDPASELGCAHVMMVAEFNGSENNYIPTDIDYHQVGLIINPTSLSTSPAAANNSLYKTTVDFVVASGFGGFTNDEYIYQGTSLETATFTGMVLSFDAATNVIRVLNTTGTPTTNGPIFGNTSKTTRTLLSYTMPNFTLFSGYMAFIENRTGIQRSPDGIEQFKFVLGY
jgi:hypothetical protein